MEQGPVLVITFISQQIMCVRDGVGKVVEGSDEKVMRVNYVWVLCRDQVRLFVYYYLFLYKGIYFNISIKWRDF